MKQVYEIDGAKIGSLDDFFDHVGETFIPGISWGRNLDAFADILAGGFGLPDEGFLLIWRHADVSKARLGYPETIKQLRKRLAQCHASNRPRVAEELRLAMQHKGPTVFNWLVEIIEDHSLEGETPKGIEFRLVESASRTPKSTIMGQGNDPSDAL